MYVSSPGIKNSKSIDLWKRQACTPFRSFLGPTSGPAWMRKSLTRYSVTRLPPETFNTHCFRPDETGGSHAFCTTNN